MKCVNKNIFIFTIKLYESISDFLATFDGMNIKRNKNPINLKCLKYFY